jgi:hypothetical protein
MKHKDVKQLEIKLDQVASEVNSVTLDINHKYDQLKRDALEVPNYDYGNDFGNDMKWLADQAQSLEDLYRALPQQAIHIGSVRLGPQKASDNASLIHSKYHTAKQNIQDTTDLIVKAWLENSGQVRPDKRLHVSWLYKRITDTIENRKRQIAADKPPTAKSQPGADDGKKQLNLFRSQEKAGLVVNPRPRSVTH